MSISSNVTQTAVSTESAEQLQQRLSDPKVADGLNRLLNRIDSIAFAVEAFEGFVARGDVIADSMAGTVAELRESQSSESKESLAALIRQTPELINTGTKIASVSKQAHLDDLEKSRLVERLTDPKTLETLNQLLDKLPLIAMVVQSLDGFLQRGDTIAENVAGLVRELKLSERKIDFDHIVRVADSLPQLHAMGEQVLQSGLLHQNLPKMLEAGAIMVDSGMLDKEVVTTLGELGRASVETFHEVERQKPGPIGGVWSIMKATKDPDVQKSMGFMFAFAKAFAKHLK